MNYPLTICIPTNRNIKGSEASIKSAISFCENNKSSLIISDNSKDNKKKKLLLTKKLPYLKTIFDGPKIAIENWLNAVKYSKSLYTLILSDDDLIYNIEEPNYSYIDAKKNDIIGIKPIISCWNQAVGIYKNNTFQINESDPLERIINYRKNYNGDNTTMYSFFETKVLKDLLSVFLYHPTRGGYTDWAFMQALVSSGKILHDNSKLLIYKNNNWFGDKKHIVNQEKNLFINAGLTERGILFSTLFRAIDVFILILRQTSPINRPILIETAKNSFKFYINIFLNFFNKNNNLFSSKEIIEISRLSLQNKVEKILEETYKVIEVFNLDLAHKYKMFYYQSLGYEWGIIK